MLNGYNFYYSLHEICVTLSSDFIVLKIWMGSFRKQLLQDTPIDEIEALV